VLFIFLIYNYLIWESLRNRRKTPMCKLNRDDTRHILYGPEGLIHKLSSALVIIISSVSSHTNGAVRTVRDGYISFGYYNSERAELLRLKQ